MIRLGYLDDDRASRTTFNRNFKLCFKVVMLDRPEKIASLDLLMNEIEVLKLDALAVDYKLADKGWVSYNGDQVIRLINEKKRYFPVFMLSSFVDSAFQKINNVFIINDKDALNEDIATKQLKKQIEGAVEAYPRIVNEIEKRTRELEGKQDKVFLTEDEELELLNLHIELSKIDSGNNSITPDKMETSAVRNLKEVVALSRELLDSLND